MIFLAICAMPGCLPAVEAWRLRARTMQAMALLCVARLVVRLLPFRYWRATIGGLAPVAGTPVPGASDQTTALPGPARRLAVHVERGAARLPFATKCLPRALALCWWLRATGIGYRFNIAARPAAMRQAGFDTHDDNLHAWVDAGGSTVLGALPGPWLVVLVLYG